MNIPSTTSGRKKNKNSKSVVFVFKTGKTMLNKGGEKNENTGGKKRESRERVEREREIGQR